MKMRVRRVGVPRGDPAARRPRTPERLTRRMLAASTFLALCVSRLLGISDGYLTRAFVRPGARAAPRAGRPAGGDLAARMPETGVAEIGGLERGST